MNIKTLGCTKTDLGDTPVVLLTITPISKNELFAVIVKFRYFRRMLEVEEVLLVMQIKHYSFQDSGNIRALLSQG